VTLREEFIVCGAAGYPDPFHCDTLEYARDFARRHDFNHVTKTKVKVTVRRRLVSDYEVVPVDPKRSRRCASCGRFRRYDAYYDKWTCDHCG
jgi:PHP family Zn ribbon phosphoesterase